MAIVAAVLALVARAQVRADRAKPHDQSEYENAGLTARVFCLCDRTKVCRRKISARDHRMENRFRGRDDILGH